MKDHNNFADEPYIDDHDHCAIVLHGKGPALVAAVKAILKDLGGNAQTKTILTTLGTREYRIYRNSLDNAPLIRPDGGAIVMDGFTV